MNLADKFKNVRKNLTSLVLAGVVALSVSGCASTYSSNAFSTPDKVDCNPVTRVIPVDKVYYIPQALGQGLVGTALEIEHNVSKAPILSPIVFPFALSWGLINTVLDTAINAACWLPLEAYEAATGQTWEKPYTPNTQAMMDSIELERAKNRYY